jgi:thiamine biosynthesis lipoprotein
MSATNGGRSIGVHHVEDVMGMAVSIDIRDARVPAAAVGAVVAWLHHVDTTFSTYKFESPISALGRGDLRFDEVSEEVRDVLRRCERLRVETDGTFDVFAVPAPNGTTLDPSGLVKGWSIEEAATILEEHGCRNFCINAGGDVALRGRPSPSEDWTIGIRHPDHRDALAMVIAGAGRLAIATSASYERGAHIVDPRTGEPSTELASATIVGPDLTVADGYATAVYVMGLEGLGWIAARPDYDAYLITRDDMTHWTPGFERYRMATDA